MYTALSGGIWWAIHVTKFPRSNTMKKWPLSAAASSGCDFVL